MGNDDWLIQKPPLVTRINDTLSIGRHPGGLEDTAELGSPDVIVNCDQVKHSLGRIHVHFPFDGEHVLPNRTLLHALATGINAWRDSGLHVLVHCAAGLNWSALVCVLCLMKREGLPAEAAIRGLRQMRSPDVLCNAYFERYLCGLHPATAGGV